ncbi:MAG TPA: hypothetical protein PKK61_04180 [Defluviitaleaceae bacterium]|nr:hypothetical protein [Defluviitaleaceae bacterium]
MTDLEKFVKEKCGQGDVWFLSLVHILPALPVELLGGEAKFYARSSKIRYDEYDEDGCHIIFQEIDWDLKKDFVSQSGQTKQKIADLLGYKSHASLQEK